MKVKRFLVKGKYLYTLVRDNNEVVFKKKNNNVMLWTKKEISYIEQVVVTLGEQYVRDYYCK